jgi:hypothetical protein
MTDPADVADQVNALSAGLGIITVQLFPLALPLLLLCIAPLLPLIVVGLLLAVIFYLPLRLVRYVTRKLTGRRRFSQVSTQKPAPTHR